MDLFKKETSNDYTCSDLNCRNVVKHTKQLNKYEKEIKRKIRRRLKQKLNKEV